MGGAVSRNVINSTLEAISRVNTTIISTLDLDNEQQQIIRIRDVENLNLSGVTQRITATLDLSALMDAMSDTNSQQDIIQAMSQSSSSLVSGINLGQFASATNQLTTYLSATLDLVTRIEQQCQAYSKTQQEIVIEQVSGFANISNITQEAMTSIITDCMQNAVAETTSVQSLQQTLDQSASSEARGVDPMGIMIAIAIVIAAIGVSIGVAGSTMGNLIVMIVFGILGIIGFVFLGLYFASIDERMACTLFSTLLEFSQECGPEILDQDETVGDPTVAGTRCFNNPDCVAFDWQSVRIGNNGVPQVISPPLTTYYSRVNIMPCTSVADDTDNQRIIYDPKVYEFEGGHPDDHGLDDAQDKDVAVDLNFLYFWIFEDRVGWTETTASGENTLLKEAPDEEFEGKLTWSKRGPVADEADASGDVWVNAANPARYQVYQYSSDTWNINNEDVPGGGYTADINCRFADEPDEPDDPSTGRASALGARRRRVAASSASWLSRTGGALLGSTSPGFEDTSTDTSTDAPTPFPPAVLPEVCANVTGFQERVEDWLFLFVAVGALVLSFMGMLAAWKKDKDSKKAAEGGDDGGGGGGGGILSSITGGIKKLASKVSSGVSSAVSSASSVVSSTPTISSSSSSSSS